MQWDIASYDKNPYKTIKVYETSQFLFATCAAQNELSNIIFFNSKLKVGILK